MAIRSRISGRIWGFQIRVTPRARHPARIAFSVAPVERSARWMSAPTRPPGASAQSRRPPPRPAPRAVQQHHMQIVLALAQLAAARQRDAARPRPRGERAEDQERIADRPAFPDQAILQWACLGNGDRVVTGLDRLSCPGHAACRHGSGHPEARPDNWSASPLPRSGAWPPAAAGPSSWPPKGHATLKPGCGKGEGSACHAVSPWKSLNE